MNDLAAAEAAKRYPYSAGGRLLCAMLRSAFVDGVTWDHETLAARIAEMEAELALWREAFKGVPAAVAHAKAMQRIQADGT